MEHIELCIILIILGALLYTAYKYSKEGDIGVLCGSIPPPWKLRDIYNTPEKIVKRLTELSVYKICHVRWNVDWLLSLCISVVIVYYYRKKIIVAELCIISVMVFLAIDIPRRFLYTHRFRSVDHEVLLLSGIFSKMYYKKTA